MPFLTFVNFLALFAAGMTLGTDDGVAADYEEALKVSFC